MNTKPIPQPRPLPILGNLTDIDTKNPVQSIMKLAQTEGPIFRLMLVGHMVTIVGSQALVNELCDEQRFEKTVHRPLEMVRDFTGDGLFTARNDEPNWARAHRLLMPAFGPLGIRGMFERMHDIADQMLTRWERFGEGAVIDVADNMTRLTLDTIALCAFDFRFNSFYQNEMHPFVAAMVGALEEAEGRAHRPEFASRVMLRTRHRYEADVAMMDKVADGLIAERRHDPDAASRNDLLNILIDGRDPETGEGLSDENIRFQMVTFLIAGHETTSGLLSFALFYLMRSPAVMRQARQLVDEVLGEGQPRIDDLARLRYLEQILMECLRLWPTAPAFAVAPREPTVIGGEYAVELDDKLLILLPLLHRDPAVWDDSEVFRPERFDPAIARDLPSNAWKPFGNGDRSCIGRGFALQEAQLTLAMILQRFDLTEADPGYKLKIAETLTMKPQGFRIHARRRGAVARPRSSVPASPPSKLKAPKAEAPSGDMTPLLVLYGSNTGSCEGFAKRIAGEAGAQGYTAAAAPMDEYVDKVPKEGAVIVVTASYEGHPPDNARRFLPWVEGLAPDALKGVRYAVFGCGNQQWASTYQAIPKRTDAALVKAGAERLIERGETDAGGDFFGGFENWYAEFWPKLGDAFGKQVAAPSASGAGGLEIEIVSSGRVAALHLTDLHNGRVLENRELVDMSAPGARSKRHIEIALPGGMSYRAGDYLAVLPRNPARDVERVLRRFGLSADTQIVIRQCATSTAGFPVDYPVNLTEVLSSYVELSQPATRLQVGQLVEATKCLPEKVALEALADKEKYEAEVLAKRVSVLDLLERFPTCDLGLGAFLSTLPPLRSRQYSISSSPLRDPERCSLTLAVLDAPALSGMHRHHGVASTFLAAVEVGARIPVAVRPSQAAFHLPMDPKIPVIMVCAGSGFAPFHGFLQERAAEKAKGRDVDPALLFFGVDHPDVDYLYKDELAAWQCDGIVDVRMAFSQAPAEDVTFVQDRVWRDRADVADYFRRGAFVFVCGDGKKMAPAVRETFVKIYQDALGVAPEEAKSWADKVERETARYVADVFD